MTTALHYSHAQCIADFSTDNIGNCDQTVTFFAATNGNPFDAVYTWDFGDGSPAVSGAIVTHEYDEFGATTAFIPVTLTVTSAGAMCTNSVTINVAVDQKPEAALTDCQTFTPFTHCGDPPYTLEVSDASSTMATNVNYMIDWGDGSPPFNGTSIPDCLPHVYNTEGFSTITLIVEGQNGCLDTMRYNFYLGGAPAVGLGIPPLGTICAPEFISFPIENVATNPEGTIYTIEVSDGSDPVILNHPPPSEYTHFFTANSCGEPNNGYSVTITASNPCDEASSTVSPIRISTSPIALIESDITDDTTCLNTMVEFCNNNISGAFITNGMCSDVVESDWSIDPPTGWVLDPNSSLDDECIDVEFTEPGVYFINLTSTNPCGSDTRQDTIWIEPPVFAEAAASVVSGDDCVPKEVQFNNNSANFTDLMWSVNPGTGWTFAPGDDNMSISPTIIFTTAGSYTVTLTVNNDCGESIWEEIVVVTDVPEIAIADPPLVCLPDPFAPVLTTFEDNGEPITDCEWLFPTGIPSSSTACDMPPNVLFSVNNDFNYFTFSATNACGTTMVMDSVYQSDPDQPVYGGPDTTICELSGCLDWTTNPGGGTFSGDLTTSEFCPGDITTIDTIMGIFSFGPANCLRIDTFYIVVVPIPEVDFGNNIPAVVCSEADPVPLSVISPLNGIWSGPGVVNDTFYPSGMNVIVNAPNTIYYSYTDTTLTGGSSLLCSATDSITIFVEGPELFNFPDTLTFCEANEIINLEMELGISEPPGATGIWPDPIFSNTNNGTFDLSTLSDTIIDLTYIYNSPNGCESTTPIVLNIEPAVVATISPALDTVCNSEGTFTFTGTPGGIGTFSGPGIDPVTGVVDLNIAPVGAPMYSYSIDNLSNCDASDDATLVIIDGASVNAGPDQFACETDQLHDLPAATPIGGTWSGPALVNGNQVDITQLSPGTYAYAYTAPNIPDACATDSITLTIEAIPVIAFEADSVACVNVATTFTNNSTGADVYAWKFGDGGLSNMENPTYTYTSTGDFQVMLTGYSINPTNTNDTLCVNSAMMDIHISEPPTLVAATADITSGCEPLTVTFDNQSLGESLSFNWDFGGVGSSMLEEPGSFTFDAINFDSTTYDVILSVDNLCGDASDTIPITVFPLPMANFGTNFNSFCSGDTLLVNDISLGYPSSISWQFPGGMPGSSTDPDPGPILYFVGNMTETYEVILTASNFCGIDQDTQSVVVAPTDVEAFFNSSTQSLCVGDTITFTSFSTPGAAITWDFGDMNTDGGEIVEHVFEEPGDYQVIQYAFGCGFDSIVTTITALPLPILDLAFEDNKCAGLPLNFEVNSSVADNTLYYGDGDSTDLTVSTHTYASGGLYPLTVVGSSGTGCQDSITSFINIFDLPVAAFSFPDSACVGAPVLFENTGGGSVSCTWDFGDGNGADGCVASYPYTDDGIFQTTLVVTSTQGCQDSITQPVYIRPTPTAFFTFDQLNDCSPALVGFTNASTQTTGLLWDFGDNSDDEIVANPQHIYNQAGTYLVTLTASNQGICFDTYTDSLTVFPIPEFSYTTDPQCTREVGTDLLIETESSNFVLVTGNNYDNSGDFHPGLQPGDYLVEVESLQGCINQDLVNILPPNELFIFLAQDSFEIQLGESVELNLNVNQQNLSIFWTPFETLSDTSGTSVTATPFQNTLYQVAVTNSLGCVKYDTAFVQVNIDRTVFIPNTFTPNNDGINDTFGVLSGNPALTSVQRFIVVDRWGEVVFEAHDCQPEEFLCEWDGTFRGKKAEQGMYTYFVELLFADGQVLPYKNSIFLMR